MKETSAIIYNGYARLYDYIFGWIFEHGRKKLAQLIHAENGEALIEAGVGTGLMLHLYPQNMSITGIDVSEKMLEIAKGRASKLKSHKITLLHSDAEETNLLSESFDHVVLPYIYSVTPTPEKLMTESFRLCRPGGHIWILNHFSGQDSIWKWVAWTVKPFSNYVGFRSNFSYEDYVSNQSWDVVSEHKVNLLGLSRIVQIRKAVTT
jgi:phosphatidylethanolamine/phosphatidyl-N-methylethanolamine N-methyltransferase